MFKKPTNLIISHTEPPSAGGFISVSKLDKVGAKISKIDFNS